MGFQGEILREEGKGSSRRKKKKKELKKRKTVEQKVKEMLMEMRWMRRLRWKEDDQERTQ